MSELDYRPYVDPTKVPRLDKAACRLSLTDYPAHFEPLLGLWGSLSQQPFKGISINGEIVQGLFSLEPSGAPVHAAVNAAAAWLASLNLVTRKRVCLPVNAEEWRHWQNTPLVLRRTQLEIEEQTDVQRRLALELIRASLSQRGWEQVQEIIACNVFLGKVNGLQEIMNAGSFTLTIFGTPSTSDPWGWQFFGHHLALNVLFVGEQMVLSPVFLGLEPDIGHLARRRMFEAHEQAALGFMRSLSDIERKKAVLYDSMLTADQPPGRFHPDDGRMVGGAFQDNRAVATEGVPVVTVGAEQRKRLLELADLFINTMPSGPADARLAEIEKYLDQSYFAWIGKVDQVNPFYFRLISPVAMMELDHHSGIFLANNEPAKFHVHAVLRTPNGNDYGADLLKQHYAQGGHDKSAKPRHEHDHSLHSHDSGKTFHRHD